jgi:hypothetical protein
MTPALTASAGKSGASSSCHDVRALEKYLYDSSDASSLQNFRYGLVTRIQYYSGIKTKKNH